MDSTEGWLLKRVGRAPSKQIFIIVISIFSITKPSHGASLTHILVVFYIKQEIEGSSFRCKVVHGAIAQ